jgi:DNA polymerase/3'-5' exonuclease PolX
MTRSLHAARSGLCDSSSISVRAPICPEGAGTLFPYRRRVEVIDEIIFVIQADDFSSVLRGMQRYGGRTALLESSAGGAVFALPAGITLRLRVSSSRDWGLLLIAETGSEAHLKKLEAVTGKMASLYGKAPFTTEAAFYQKFSLAYILNPNFGKATTK